MGALWFNRCRNAHLGQFTTLWQWSVSNLLRGNEVFWIHQPWSSCKGLMSWGPRKAKSHKPSHKAPLHYSIYHFWVPNTSCRQSSQAQHSMVSHRQFSKVLPVVHRGYLARNRRFSESCQSLVISSLVSNLDDKFHFCECILFQRLVIRKFWWQPFHAIVSAAQYSQKVLR